MLKILRRALAALTLVAMTLVFVIPGAGVVSALGWVPRSQLVPAVCAGEALAIVAILAATLLAGRAYCAVMCPLGIAQDLARAVLRWCRVARSPRYGEGRAMSNRLKILRYIVLVLFVLLSFVGLTGLIEPYGIFGRFLTAISFAEAEMPILLSVWSIALFVFILAMTWFRARWWCNFACPVGTLLGLCSRRSVWRVRIDGERCVGCGRCAAACDKGAIFRNGKRFAVDAELCVACQNCRGICEHLK